MATSDITIRRGTTKPDMVWRLITDGQIFDAAGSVLVLTIVSASNRIVKSTADPGSGLTYDGSTGNLRWHRTLAESRMIGLGRVGKYEIERRVGTDQSYLVSGYVIGAEGLSDD